MKEQPPQDDDPNSSTLNPMGEPLSSGFFQAGFFPQKLGIGRIDCLLDKTPLNR